MSAPARSEATRRAQASRDPRVERRLEEEFHVGYQFVPNVDVDQFDVEASLQNQARFTAIDEKVVERYTEAVLRGEVLPAPIAHRPGRAKTAKLVSVDGNHRLVAHQRAGLPLPGVYELDRGVKAQTINTMMNVFNAEHGSPLSDDERVYAALHYINNGLNLEEAAAVTKAPLKLLRKAVAQERADKRAREIGVEPKKWDPLPQSAKAAINRISTDEGFEGALNLAVAAKLDVNEIFDLVALLNTSKSASRQRTLLNSERDRYGERIQAAASRLPTGAGLKGRAVTPRSRVGMVVGQALALPDDMATLARSWKGEERRETAKRLDDAIARLTKLKLALEESA